MSDQTKGARKPLEWKPGFFRCPEPTHGGIVRRWEGPKERYVTFCPVDGERFAV